jgi:hypothetical protein
MNIAEYVIWILAFNSNHFEEFRRGDKYQAENNLKAREI